MDVGLERGGQQHSPQSRWEHVSAGWQRQNLSAARARDTDRLEAGGTTETREVAWPLGCNAGSKHLGFLLLLDYFYIHINSKNSHLIFRLKVKTDPTKN